MSEKVRPLCVCIIRDARAERLFEHIVLRVNKDYYAHETLARGAPQTFNLRTHSVYICRRALSLCCSVSFIHIWNIKLAGFWAAPTTGSHIFVYAYTVLLHHIFNLYYIHFLKCVSRILTVAGSGGCGWQNKQSWQQQQ